jgi:FkbM family methyltransferase
MNTLPKHLRESRQSIIGKYQAACTGIFHLGAHMGQERDYYHSLGKPVLWVEANSHIFERLCENIKAYPEQSALCALLGDEDGRSQQFHISNNSDGVSSSVYPFGEYAAGEKSLWPDLGLTMVSTMMLETVRLDTLLIRNKIDAKDYNFWILDLQGSEKIALGGAVISLRCCNHLLVEVSKEEVYRGAPLFDELNQFLKGEGYLPLWEPYLPHDDVLYIRKFSLSESAEHCDNATIPQN